MLYSLSKTQSFEEWHPLSGSRGLVPRRFYTRATSRITSVPTEEALVCLSGLRTESMTSDHRNSNKPIGPERYLRKGRNKQELSWPVLKSSGATPTLELCIYTELSDTHFAHRNFVDNLITRLGFLCLHFTCLKFG